MREPNSDKLNELIGGLSRRSSVRLGSASGFNVLVKIAVKAECCTANVQFIQLIGHSDPIRSLIRPATSVEGLHSHADAGHQSTDRGANLAEAEDSADAVREYAVAHKLIELTTLEVFVLHDQALGGGKGHRERVFGHWLGVAAAVGCYALGVPSAGMKPTPASGYAMPIFLALVVWSHLASRKNGHRVPRCPVQAPNRRVADGCSVCKPFKQEQRISKQP